MTKKWHQRARARRERPAFYTNFGTVADTTPPVISALKVTMVTLSRHVCEEWAERYAARLRHHQRLWHAVDAPDRARHHACADADRSGVSDDILRAGALARLLG